MARGYAVPIDEKKFSYLGNQIHLTVGGDFVRRRLKIKS
jgi:hypothetical protein